MSGDYKQQLDSYGVPSEAVAGLGAEAGAEAAALAIQRMWTPVLEAAQQVEQMNADPWFVANSGRIGQFAATQPDLAEMRPAAAIVEATKRFKQAEQHYQQQQRGRTQWNTPPGATHLMPMNPNVMPQRGENQPTGAKVAHQPGDPRLDYHGPEERLRQQQRDPIESMRVPLHAGDVPKWERERTIKEAIGARLRHPEIDFGRGLGK